MERQDLRPYGAGGISFSKKSEEGTATADTVARTNPAQAATPPAPRQVRLFRPRVCEEAIDAVAEVLRSGWIGMGPKTEQFEKDFAAYIGAPHCVAVNTCTSALQLALRVLDLPEGAEVITTPLTFVATNHAILHENLKPVFADIQPSTGNLDVHSIQSRITPNTGAIMLVHFAGYPCDLDEIYALADTHGLPVVEDCAHACGAIYKGRRVGSHGRLHAFSFHATKNLTTGDGGALTLDSPQLAGRLARLRCMGMDRDIFQRLTDAEKRYRSWDYEVSEVGFSYHMNDIKAAMGIVQLKYLDRDNAQRAEIAAVYRAELAGVPGVRLLDYKEDRESSYHLFCILVEDRDRLIKKLTDAGVIVGVHYKRNDVYPMYGEQDLPGTEYFHSRVMSLPMHLDLTDDDLSYVTRLIKEGW